MSLDPHRDATLISRIEAALNEAYLDEWRRESAEERFSIENEVFRRYNQACEYAVPWVNHIAPLAGSRVVEIGCGTGSSTCAFAQLAGQVQGYDISPSYVAGALNRARALGLTNVAGQAIAPEQLLNELRCRHEAEKADFVLLYAVLEHCTSEECLETLRASWDVLRPGGHLVVIETPNRFGYMDIHTAFLPFFHMLPGPIALRYYHRSQRQKIIRTLDQALFVSEQEAELARIRLGTGISFHDFQIALDIEDLGPVLAADGYEPEMLAWFPITLEERLLQTFFLARDVPAPIGFTRSVLNLILRKPVGAMPDEPLLPLVSRAEFITNYQCAKIEAPSQQTHWRQAFDQINRTVLMILENQTDLIIPGNELNIEPDHDIIRFKATGYDPCFYLPPVEPLPKKALMKIEMDAPGHSTLQVFHVTTDAPDYTEGKSSRVPIYRGRNTLIVELPPGVTGHLRIDPGEIPGEYRIYHIEIRCEP
ncbi:MAG TPA: class I SAM-dependent methyltransferase [Candidatus Competibacteraceae bacterium]|nr:class I SAM-dependent methyltransferase [Candidatus Competibacteraceae bacterium]